MKHELGRYLTRFPYCILCIVVRAECNFSQYLRVRPVFHSLWFHYLLSISIVSRQHREAPSLSPCFAPNPISHYHLNRILFGFVFGCCLLLSYEDFMPLNAWCFPLFKELKLFQEICERLSIFWYIGRDIEFDAAELILILFGKFASYYVL